MKIIVNFNSNEIYEKICATIKQDGIDVVKMNSEEGLFDIIIEENFPEFYIKSKHLDSPIVVKSEESIYTNIHTMIKIHEIIIEKNAIHTRFINTQKQLIENNSKIKSLNNKIIYDSKLNCYNFSFFNRQIDIELDKYKRYTEPFSLIMLDLDQFKGLNDTLGHGEGDRVLEQVCDAMQRTIRVVDSIFRFGGDEFVIIVHNAIYLDALITAERVRKSIYNLGITYNMNSELRRITCSIGISTVSNEEEYEEEINPKMLVENADKALYEAKRKGKNRAIHFSDLI